MNILLTNGQSLTCLHDPPPNDQSTHFNSTTTTKNRNNHRTIFPPFHRKGRYEKSPPLNKPKSKSKLKSDSSFYLLTSFSLGSQFHFFLFLYPSILLFSLSCQLCHVFYIQHRTVRIYISRSPHELRRREGFSLPLPQSINQYSLMFSYLSYPTKQFLPHQLIDTYTYCISLCMYMGHIQTPDTTSLPSTLPFPA